MIYFDNGSLIFVLYFSHVPASVISGTESFLYLCDVFFSLAELTPYFRVIVYNKAAVRHVTGNDQDYLRKIPRAVVQISALL